MADDGSAAYAAFMYATAEHGGPAWDAWWDELLGRLAAEGFDVFDVPPPGHNTMPDARRRTEMSESKIDRRRRIVVEASKRVAELSPEKRRILDRMKERARRKAVKRFDGEESLIL